MNLYYSRVPAAAIKMMFDGNLYAFIPHRFAGNVVVEDFNAPRMVRFSQPESFIADGVAFVWFANRGDALPVPGVLPFGVTMMHRDEGAA